MIEFPSSITRSTPEEYATVDGNEQLDQSRAQLGSGALLFYRIHDAEPYRVFGVSRASRLHRATAGFVTVAERLLKHMSLKEAPRTRCARLP